MDGDQRVPAEATAAGTGAARRRQAPAGESHPGGMMPFDPATPNIARVWDYWLGGKDNFAVDRELAETMLQINPLAAQMARENRQFLGRAVTYIAAQGIDQFIDVGAGLPTALNTHDVAQRADPGAKVVYVDNDPMVISHARALLAKDSEVAVVPGDVRSPDAILADPELAGVIRLNDPVCVLLSGVLHFLDAAQARAVATAFTRAIAPGSYLLISVGTGQSEVATPFTAAYTAATLHIHAADEVMTFFEGLELVPPGLVPARGWVGGAPPQQLAARQATFLAGVGRKAPR
jgi:O-methyltransferase involved in polyketide biosynthesis